MAIWNHEFDLNELNETSKGTMGEAIGLEFTAMGDDYLEATMPVDHRTIQPHGLLHGGASVTLAETLGSVAAMLVLKNPKEQAAVGIEINANHMRGARSGYVTGRVTPLRIGRNIQVWTIEIRDEKDQLICQSRLTTMTVNR